jgi:hypothetical protein
MKTCKHPTCENECRREKKPKLRTPIMRKAYSIKRTEIKKKASGDAKLWKVFSMYIRLRDADDQGICKCFTCNHRAHWKKMDCGHGIGRQHWGTRYSERNNHAQCKGCNGFNGGRMDVYKTEVDKKYGAGTWDLLEVTRNGKRLSDFEIGVLTKHYLMEIAKMSKDV